MSQSLFETRHEYIHVGRGTSAQVLRLATIQFLSQLGATTDPRIVIGFTSTSGGVTTLWKKLVRPIDILESLNGLRL